MAYRLDRRLWLTAERDRVVEDGDPEAAFLLGAPGQILSDAEAQRYGLTGKKADAQQLELPDPDKQTDQKAQDASRNKAQAAQAQRRDKAR